MIQTESNTPVCGKYTDRQLNNWGEESKKSFAKLPSSAASTLILMLAQLTSSDSADQVTTNTQVVVDSTIAESPVVESKDTVTGHFKGHIWNENDGAPIFDAKVLIRNKEGNICAGAFTDEFGIYSIKLRYPVDVIRRFDFVIIRERQEVIDDLSQVKEALVNKDYNLQPVVGIELIAFSVRVPPSKKWKRRRCERKLNGLTEKTKISLH
ncbi:MAG: hypothetical protein HRT57_10130 [Crocinitomicaceae bacterium]|nr:hypothetical protein [Crocinitomicaceae bacterium]